MFRGAGIPAVWRLLARPFQFLTPLAGIVAGCARPDVPRPEFAPRGCVFMIPGIEGTTWQFGGTVRGLRQAGLDCHIEPIAWGKHPFRQLHNLCALASNRKRARDMADRIAKYKATHPDAPIALIGYSGGGGMAVLTAEALPPGVMLDRLILVAAAISPRYDLSRALARTKYGLINYYSPRDWAFLGLGTSVFGTIDRHRGPSAGRVGFQDGESRLIQSPRIVQVAWRREWKDLGHNGGHIGWLSSRWARGVLAGHLPLPGKGREKPPEPQRPDIEIQQNQMIARP